MAATNSAVTPAVDNSWLAIDATANDWSGRKPHEPRHGDAPNPKVPSGADASLVDDNYDVAPASDGVQYVSDGWNGAWPGFSQGEWTQGPVPLPVGNAEPGPDPYEARNGYNGKTNAYEILNQYAGHNAHSQMTDNHGWDQYTPTGRVAERRIIGDASRGFEYLWYETAERPAPKRFAATAVAGDGNNGNLNDALPDYASTAYGGPGNIAYETPAPPVTTQAQAQAATPVQWKGW